MRDRKINTHHLREEKQNKEDTKNDTLELMLREHPTWT